MKRRELKKCAVCDRGMMHSGNISFYHVKVEHMVVNLPAVQRLAGLEMLTQSPLLADVLGPDEDIALKASFYDVLICQDCAIREASIAQIVDGEAHRQERVEAEHAEVL